MAQENTRHKNIIQRASVEKKEKRDAQPVIKNATGYSHAVNCDIFYWLSAQLYILKPVYYRR